MDAVGHPDGRYFEPFAGSACLFFALAPARAVLGDLNAELLEAYATIRDYPSEVARATYALEHAEGGYYAVRARNPDALDPVDRAARFVWLNRRCFNGVYRTNRQGQFNVPQGRRSGRLPTPGHFEACAQALRQAELRAGDFAATVRDCRPGDVVYLDPPYSRSAHGNYGVYGYGSFDGRELTRLENALHDLNQRGVRFVLSYRDVDGLAQRLSDFTVRQLTVRAQVAANAAARRDRDELLVTNGV